MAPKTPEVAKESAEIIPQLGKGNNATSWLEQVKTAAVNQLAHPFDSAALAATLRQGAYNRSWKKLECQMADDKNMTIQSEHICRRLHPRVYCSRNTISYEHTDRMESNRIGWNKTGSNRIEL